MVGHGSDLSFKVDVVEVAKIPADFKAIIDEDGVPFV